MIKVSVIIAAYNAEKYIERCLDSVVMQSYKDLEIIIVNDGSKDKTEEILKKYADEYSNIKVIKQKNQGCVIARKNGIFNASGEYCMFVDSDDWIEKNTVEKLVEKITKYNADIVKFRFIMEPMKTEQKTYFSDSEKIFTDNKLVGEKLLSTYYYNNLCNEIIKKSIIDLNREELSKNINQSEDFLINIDIFYKAKSILVINDIYYHYFYNCDSITHVTNKGKIKKNIKDLIDVYEVKNKYIKIFELDSDIKVKKKIEHSSLTGICNQTIKLLSCKKVKKSDLKEIEDYMTEKDFYSIVNSIIKDKGTDSNIIKKVIKRNILKRKYSKNFKYKFICKVANVIKNKR